MLILLTTVSIAISSISIDIKYKVCIILIYLCMAQLSSGPNLSASIDRHSANLIGSVGISLAPGVGFSR